MLANEQVVDGRGWRSGALVEKRLLSQWFLRITAFSDELLDGLKTLERWPERVRLMQENWIGRSEGARVFFELVAGGGRAALPDGSAKIEVFTTRPDTLWGATFMVFSPEHPLVDGVTTPERKAAVEAYKLQAARQSDIEREAADKDKTGVFTGGYAVNPVNHERIPIWIADYVLMSYGTGAIMAVPAHDERDFAFAR